MGVGAILILGLPSLCTGVIHLIKFCFLSSDDTIFLFNGDDGDRLWCERRPRLSEDILDLGGVRDKGIPTEVTFGCHYVRGWRGGGEVGSC